MTRSLLEQIAGIDVYRWPERSKLGVYEITNSNHT